MLLHILWMIIKIILIVLGILLGLVLLAILLLLFCPVRYRAAAEKPAGAELKDISGEGCISWLFHGISLYLSFQDGELKNSVQIFGIPLEKLAGLKKKRGASKKKRASRRTAPKEKSRAEPLEAETETTAPEEEMSIPEEEAAAPQETEAIPAKRSHKVPTIAEKPRKTKKTPVWKRIGDKFRKIIFTLRNMYDKIDWWKQFFSHPKVKAALSLVWKEGKGLIKHVLPVKIEGNVIFGSEDPAVTGSVLAALGMTIPFHKNRIAVTPVFDGENILEGNVKIKGRIYGCVLLNAAAQIYFNKNVKYVIRRWRHKEV